MARLSRYQSGSHEEDQALRLGWRVLIYAALLTVAIVLMLVSQRP